MKSVLIVAACALRAACGGGSDDDGESIAAVGGGGGGGATGVITLSGTDTSAVGTQLQAGAISALAATPSFPAYAIVVNPGSTIINAGGAIAPQLANPNNGFVVTVFGPGVGAVQSGISMIIRVNGAEYAYACSTPVVSHIECGMGSLSLNVAARTLALSDTTVINTGTGATLTLNGNLSW